MRGSTADVRERQRPYVDDFRDAAPVLDVGCGRGELLGLLRDAGIEARGVDADADMVAYARGEGLEVEQADALALPRGARRTATLGGIFAGQVVEHLPPADALPLPRARRREAPPGRPARRGDDQPALAARAPLLLRRPDPRAAARPRDARAAGEAGRLPRGRDALPQRAAPRRRRRRADPRDPLRAARLRDRRHERENRRLPAAGAVRARRRRDLHRRPRRGARSAAATTPTSSPSRSSGTRASAC